MRIRRLSLLALRMLLWASTVTVLLVVTLALSERGTALAARTLSAVVPGLVLEHRSGSLLEPYFTRIAWHDDTTRVSAEEVRWALTPHCLLSDRLCISSLMLARLDIVLGPSEADPAPFDLEPLLTPMPVTITHAGVDVLEIRQAGSKPLTLSDIRFAGSFEGSRIMLESLVARMGEFEATLDAEIDLRRQLPLRVSGHLDRAHRQQAELHLSGDLAHLGFQIAGSGEYAIDAEGFVELLAAAPRVELSASSRETLYPLPDDPAAAALHDIVLRVSGSSKELHARFAANLGGTLTGAAQLEGTARWTPDQTQLTGFELSGEAGRLTATGKLLGSHWQATLHAEDFCPLAWRPQFECRLSGDTTLEGDIDDASSSIDARIALGGTINGREARIEGMAARSSNGDWQLTAMHVLNGANRLQLEGSIGAVLALDATLELSTLDGILADAHGSGLATLHVGGTPEDPQIDGRLTAQGLRWQAYAADSIALRVHWPGLNAGSNLVRLDAKGLLIEGTAVDALTVAVDGPVGAHRIALDTQAGEVRLVAACAGALGKDGDWRGNCDTLTVTPHPTLGEWRLDHAVTLAWDAGGKALQIGAFCLRNAETALCSERSALLAADRFTDIVLSGRNIPLPVFGPWLPAELQGDGLLTLDARASRAAGRTPHFEAHVSGTAMSLEIPVAGDTLAFELNGFTASLQGSAERATLAWQLVLRGGGGLDGKLGVDLMGRRLDGTVSLDALELARFAALLPGMLDMGGTLGGELHLQGALDAPQVAGTLQLVGGSFVHERLPEPISDATVMIDFIGSKARIDGHFRTGSGSATLDGDVLFGDEGWNADLGFRSSGLQIEPLRGSTATVVPQLRLQLSSTRALLSGEVYLPSANIRIDTLPETAVSESPYAIVVGEEHDAMPFSYGLEVQVRLGEQVRLRGMGVDARLEGALDITRNADDGLLRGRGEIRIAEGRYKAYGQSLEITEGQIRFRGALDRPDLRLTAIRRIEEDNVQVGVSVRGNLREPVISTFSRPAMEETLAMYYLLTGRKPEANGNMDLAVTGMLLQLGVAGASRITGSAASRFGIQDFQLAARQVEGGTEVQLSAYLAPDLYLRYGVSTFDRINTIRLRYRLRGSFYVEAISGIENAIDFLYSFER